MINSIKIFCIFILGLGGSNYPLKADAITVAHYSFIASNNIAEMKEIFKPVKDYDGLYEVSNLGRVKSLKRSVFNGKGFYINPEIILKSHINKTTGYESVILTKNSEQILYLVHRLVLSTFILNTENKRTVNHKDGVKTNNNVDNLEWNTYSENILHSFANGLQKPSKPWLGKFGADNNSSKVVLQYNKNGNFIRKYVSMTEASKVTGILRTSISNNCHLISKTAGGYIWKFKV